LARPRPEGLAAALPLGGADRALARAAGALLPPRLPAAARGLAAPARGGRAPAPVGHLADDALVDEGHAHRRAEHLGELHAALRAAVGTEDGQSGHPTSPPSAAAPWSASRSCA